MSGRDTFEKKFARLEEVVKELENGNLTLEKSLELYKEGINLSRDCQKILRNAELQVKMIVQAEDDKPVMTSFDNSGGGDKGDGDS